MKAERITEWDGEKLSRFIDIFWWKNKEYKGMILSQQFGRWLSNLYYKACWWLYDHTDWFNPIEEGQRFSWKSLGRGK